MRDFVDAFREAGELLTSAPNSDGYGGGTVDVDFVNKVKVLCSSLGSALTSKLGVQHSQGLRVIYDVEGESPTSFKVVVKISFQNVLFEVLSLEGCVGSSYSGSVMGKSVSGYTSNSIDNDLVVSLVDYLLKKFNIS